MSFSCISTKFSRLVDFQAYKPMALFIPKTLEKRVRILRRIIIKKEVLESAKIKKSLLMLIDRITKKHLKGNLNKTNVVRNNFSSREENLV